MRWPFKSSAGAFCARGPFKCAALDQPPPAPGPPQRSGLSPPGPPSSGVLSRPSPASPQVRGAGGAGTHRAGSRRPERGSRRRGRAGRLPPPSAARRTGLQPGRALWFRGPPRPGRSSVFGVDSSRSGALTFASERGKGFETAFLGSDSSLRYNRRFPSPGVILMSFANEQLISALC